MTTLPTTVTPPAVAPPRTTRPPLQVALRNAVRRPLVIASFGWLALVSLASLFASSITHLDPLEQDILTTLAPPSGAHPLGTDDVGRDILSRLLHGGGSLLLTSLESVVIALVIGVPLGMLAGYIGGRYDAITSFAVNVLIAVPGFVILVAVVVASGNRLEIVMGVLGLLFSANFFRLVRATTQSARSLPYVDSARVAGLSRARILARHVLPNVTGPLVVQAFLTYSVALIIATSLAFLGLGLSPETPNWGQMVFVATQNLGTDPWMMVPVGAVLILTIMAANFIGSAIRDALPQAQRPRLFVDPRLRRRPAPASVAAGGADAVYAPPAAQSQSPNQSPNEDDDASGAGASYLLEVDELTVSFPSSKGEQAVVDRVSFVVRRGETLGLVGESGCGKTMTALAMLGLVPPPGQISGGRVRLDGMEVTGLAEREWGRLRGTSIAYIAQEPIVALDPCFTIGSLLREPLRRHRGLSRRAADAQALALLKLVGIARPEAVAKSYPHQISGGMAQRVGIALALTGEPKLLIADEPTTALDVTIQAEILDLLRSLQERLGMTIVIVTHDLGVVADLCTSVAVMYAGQVVEVGSVDDVLTRPTHPYTRGLLGATPDLTSPGATLPTVEGSVPLPQNWPAWCRFEDRCPFAVEACRRGAVPLVESRIGVLSRCVRAHDVLEATA